MSSERTERQLARVYQSETSDARTAAYDDWASTYEADLGKLGWDAPARCADALTEHLNDTTARIMDAGCGPGQVGVELHARAYTNLCALDLSAAMLAEAQSKAVYQEHLLMGLSAEMDLESQSFDAIVASGVFTQGHADATCLPELVRILKPGGLLVFSLRPDLAEAMGFQGKTANESMQHLELIHESEDLAGFSAIQTNPYRVRVYRRGKD